MNATMILLLIIISISIIYVNSDINNYKDIDNLLKRHYYQHPQNVISSLSLNERIALHRFLIHIDGYNKNITFNTDTNTNTNGNTNTNANTFVDEKPKYNPIYCRDPDLGGHMPVNLRHRRKFLMIGGKGNTIANNNDNTNNNDNILILILIPIYSNTNTNIV